MVCVRFAPSPTGNLHIGGIRTALFNFLYARNQKGRFILRIEDTDRERSTPEFENEILESLAWLGLESDGEIWRQSQRLDIYRKHAAELVEKGLAYDDKTGQGTAVRFRMPKQKAAFFDLIHDKVEFDTTLLDDLVILKSDGYPTYHWACVVDDHEMDITHVIRGDDHISNTPKQICLYEAMGWKPPKFAHLPLILGDDGTPLSKRHGAVALAAFRKQGFLKEALLNYLALLGWGVAGGNEEIFSMAQLIEKFSLKRVNKSGARFNLEKLEWLNSQYLKNISEEDYLRRIGDFYPDRCGLREATWKKLVLLYRNRIKTFSGLTEQASYCFQNQIQYDPAQQRAFLETVNMCDYLNAWLKESAELESFEDVGAIEQMTRLVCEKLGIEAKILIHPLRYALTGHSVSPGLFELMSVMGKETCLSRVQRFIL
ncbi:MAG: hypothetical protein A2Z83_03365 [Omnitrophica bacterium GWA2_52_8]|nr:MAG: hypothetical protein A2Z83_03365 [Omnitrophica bacterium GWA2_52_8]